MTDLTSSTCGCIDIISGGIPTAALAQPEVADVFGNRGGIALNKRGDVTVVPRERTPAETAAAYRRQ